MGVDDGAHGGVQGHGVVGWEVLEFFCGPGFEGVRGVAAPVPGFEIEVAVQEGGEGGEGGGEIAGGEGGGIVGFVVFEGRGELGEGAVDVFCGGGGCGGGGGSGEERGPFEGVREEDDARWVLIFVLGEETYEWIGEKEGKRGYNERKKKASEEDPIK